ncbi:MAG: acyl-ACP--UDP-N-acetylglucosamine O-acyltransferase [Pseudomonadota bacterium]|nr:acyl-ACP--UDP-N-acetylglucosamine O-acyltransferase [Pseudomonadota bacterium]
MSISSITVKPKNTSIHHTAEIDSSAEIADNVIIGPYAIIHPRVKIGKDCKIAAHAVIYPDTVLGEKNTVHSFACIGSDPQVGHDKPKGQGSLTVGEENTFHEFVTISRGCAGSETCIGNYNLFQAYTHVGHDCIINNHTILVNNATLGGHVVVEDYAIVGAFTTVHQFCKIGESSITARGAKISNDIVPYIIVADNPPKPFGLNNVGLQRRGFSEEVRAKLKKAYKIIIRQRLTVEKIEKALDELIKNCPEVEKMVTFLKNSDRGITR